MDGPRVIQSKYKSEREKQISYINTYIRFLKPVLLVQGLYHDLKLEDLWDPQDIKELIPQGKSSEPER